MNWVALGEHLISALVGGLITGVMAWTRFNTALKLLEARVESFKDDCEVCRNHLTVQDSKLSGSLDNLRASVTQHHESGPHFLPSDRQLMDERWTEIRERLKSIEEYLRNGRRKEMLGA